MASILDAAAWSYATLYEEHADLAQRVLFYDDKYSGIKVEG